MEGERVLIFSEFRDLDDSAPMSEEQIKGVIAHIDRLLKENKSKPQEGVRAWLDARTKDEKSVGAARRRLVEVGLPEERVLRFPADQVILLDERREYEVRRDEMAKLMPLPDWQLSPLEALLTKAEKAREPALFDFLVPATWKVRRAQGRLEQRIALLRHVEALRLYAAAHDGQLPGKLADVPVPLPPDPITGKPFHYHVDGATAHLRGSPPPGLEKEPAFNVHYAVTIQK
jgi:hypothetical protein